LSEASVPPGIENPAENRPGSPPEPPSIADGLEHHLDPRSVQVGRIVIGILAGIAAFVVLFWTLIVLVFGSDAPLIHGTLIVAGYLGALVIWRGGLRLVDLEHQHTSYRVTEQGIEIREGVWWRTAKLAARSRIQHTDVTQGPLQRQYSVATLKLYTAGTEHSEVTLSGLAHERALAIRDYLGSTAGADVV